MLHLINVLISFTVLKKLAPSFIWLYCTFTFKLNYQLVTIIVILTLFNSYKNTYLVLLKLVNSWKLYIFTKGINKSLFYNKLAPYHIVIYVVTLIITLRGLKKYNLNIFLAVPGWVALTLGGLWSVQEVLWGGIWNWNLIEITILYIVVSLSLLYHYGKLTLYVPKLLTFLIIMFFYFNHVPLTLSVHNFVNNKYTKVSCILTVTMLVFILNFSTYYLQWLIITLWSMSYLMSFLSLNSVSVYIVLETLTVLTIFNLLLKNYRIWMLLLALTNLVSYFIVIITTLRLLRSYSNKFNYLWHSLIQLTSVIFVIVQYSYFVFFKYHLISAWVRNYTFCLNKDLVVKYFCVNKLTFLQSKSVVRKNKLLLTVNNTYLTLKVN